MFYKTLKSITCKAAQKGQKVVFICVYQQRMGKFYSSYFDAINIKKEIF